MLIIPPVEIVTPCVMSLEFWKNSISNQRDSLLLSTDQVVVVVVGLHHQAELPPAEDLQAEVLAV